MRYTLIRNAAAVLELGGIRFLIDPALDPAGTRSGSYGFRACPGRMELSVS